MPQAASSAWVRPCPWRTRALRVPGYTYGIRQRYSSYGFRALVRYLAITDHAVVTVGWRREGGISIEMKCPVTVNAHGASYDSAIKSAVPNKAHCRIWCVDHRGGGAVACNTDCACASVVDEKIVRNYSGVVNAVPCDRQDQCPRLYRRYSAQPLPAGSTTHRCISGHRQAINVVCSRSHRKRRIACEEMIFP